AHSLQQFRQTIEQASSRGPADLDKGIKAGNELLTPHAVVEHRAMIGKKQADDLDKPICSKRLKLKAVLAAGVQQSVGNEIKDAPRVGRNKKLEKFDQVIDRVWRSYVTDTPKCRLVVEQESPSGRDVLKRRFFVPLSVFE